MGSKILRKMAAQLQTTASYESAAMAQMSFTDGILNQGFDPIEDDGILGNGFPNTPQQGQRHVGGSYSLNVDAKTIPVLLEAGLGRKSSTAYDFNGSHALKLSVAELNAVNCIKYTSAYIKTLKFSGSKGANLKLDVDLFSTGAQTREAVGNFPTIVTAATTPMTFHELGGATGYFRIGDQADALATGDRISIESFSADIISGFEEEFANENDLLDARGSFTPVWGMVQPGVKFSFKVPRYTVEQYQTWQDANTALQAEMYVYKSATATLKMQIPNFTVKVSLETGDLTSVNVECMVGRNGIGSSYTNTYMAFNSPVKFTVVNS